MIKVREFTTEINSIRLSAIEENKVPNGMEKVAIINEVISDEQAKLVVKTLEKKGYKAIVSSLFSDKIENAAIKSNIIPLRVSDNFMKTICNGLRLKSDTKLKVDMVQQEVQLVSQLKKERFLINPMRRFALMNGIKTSNSKSKGLVIG